MFRGQGKTILIFLNRQGVSHPALQLPKISPRMMMQTELRSLHRSSLIKSHEFRRMTHVPWIVAGGTCVFGLLYQQFWMKSSGEERGNYFVSCAGEEQPTFETFCDRHVISNKTVMEMKEISAFELEEIMQEKLGPRYGMKTLHTFILSSNQELERVMKKEMDQVIDDDGNETRKENWDFKNTIDSDDYYSRLMDNGGTMGGTQVTHGTYNWMPSEWDVLQCVWDGEQYHYYIGYKYKVLVKLSQVKLIKSKQGMKIRRPIDIIGIAGFKFYQNHFETSDAIWPALYQVKLPATDHIKKTLEYLYPLCPKSNPVVDSRSQTDKPKPTFAPTPLNELRMPVPQRHATTSFPTQKKKE